MNIEATLNNIALNFEQKSHTIPQKNGYWLYEGVGHLPQAGKTLLCEGILAEETGTILDNSLE
ncbi:MAG TPA: hypothetical protein VJZ49_10840 [Syntrophales bacterium]|nr:hypothetical protein [Syntrophales bacterium]